MKLSADITHLFKEFCCEAEVAGSDLTERLESEFRKYEYFYERENWWMAVYILAEIYNVLNSNALSAEVKEGWMTKIMKPGFNTTIIGNMNATFRRDYESMKKITSANDTFSDDDYLLLISYHTGLSLVKEYLAARKLGAPDFDLSEIERKIVETGRKDINQSNFQKAIKQVQGDSKLPLDIIWLKNHLL